MPTEFFYALFVKPIQITDVGRLAMLVPLALSISIVYKTIRCERLQTVPLASLTLTFTIVAGMMLIGVLLVLVFHLLA